jgi:trigger factor
MEAVGQAAEGTSPKKRLERLKSAGRLDALKEDLAQRRALDLVTESAKPVAAEPAPASS